MYEKDGQARVRLEMLEEEDASQSYLRFTAPNDEQYTAEFCASYVGGKRRERSSWVNLVGPRGSGLALDAGPISQIEVRSAEPGEKGSPALSPATGVPSITMDDRQGKHRLLLRLMPDGFPRVSCRDKAEKVTWQAPPETKDSSSEKPKNQKEEKND